MKATLRTSRLVGANSCCLDAAAPRWLRLWLFRCPPPCYRRRLQLRANCVPSPYQTQALKTSKRKADKPKFFFLHYNDWARRYFQPMLSPAAPTKPMKDAPAAACHDRPLLPKISHSNPVKNKTFALLRFKKGDKKASYRRHGLVRVAPSPCGCQRGCAVRQLRTLCLLPPATPGLWLLGYFHR